MNPFNIVQQALTENLAPARRPKHWRDHLRSLIGDNAEEIHSILFDLARGKPIQVELPDGQISLPVLPSRDVSLRAAIYLHEALVGKAVAQTEIQKAEEGAQEMQAIRALSDSELEAEAAKIIEARRVGRLTPGSQYAEYADLAAAQPTPDTIAVQPSDLALRIWSAPAVEEQE